MTVQFDTTGAHLDPTSSHRHLIASVRGDEPGPTLIAIAGIHGDEPAAVRALRRVAAELERRETPIRGEFLALVANTRALEAGVRYVDEDLNRIWSVARVAALRAHGLFGLATSEEIEQCAIIYILDPALARARGEVYFVDLHTTSAGGPPFTTIGDTLRNRSFASRFPVPVILGLEEQVDGTLLEFVNNLGVITLGFEAGPPEPDASIDRHEAAIWTALVATGNVEADDIPSFDRYLAELEQDSGGRRLLEVCARHRVRPGDEFRMEPGLENLQPVKAGQRLARDWRGAILAEQNGVVLLPMYRPLGGEGFFVCRDVRPVWLRMSSLLRTMMIPQLIHLLPGVCRHATDPDTLFVNTRIASLFPLQIFHLLGFRKRRWSEDLLLVSRRRYDLAGPNWPRLRRSGLSW